MKIYKLNFAILMLLSLPIKSFGQFNPQTNCYESPEKSNVITHQQKNISVLNSMSGIPCNSNSFFATNGINIEEYELVGSTITYLGTTLQGANQVNLAYCNNLDSGVFSPTFYSSNASSPNYFDGTNWITASASTLQNLYNPGGHSNFLYYQAAIPGHQAKKIIRYDGTSLNLVYTTPYPRSLVADLSVDDSDNLWFLTMSDTLNAISDSIFVLSPSGQITKRFSFVYNLYNSYGSFLLNGTLYIGLGSVNPVSPNSLLPITIVLDSAIAGSPINFPASAGFYDLASCNPGLPTFVTELTLENNYSLFPNPTSTLIKITSNEYSRNEYKIFNINGVKLGESIITNERITSIDVHLLSSGIYYLECKNDKGIFRKKFIKLQYIL